MQQLEKSQQQHATIRFGGKFMRQQIEKYCRFRQQLKKMWQQIPSRNTSIRAQVQSTCTPVNLLNKNS